MIPMELANPSSSRALRDSRGILRILDSAADDGVDIHRELGVLGEIFQFLVEHLQALHGNIVRLEVVDADLQMFEAGIVQRHDLLRRQQISVGDHSGNHAVMTNSLNDLLDFGMQQRFAAADRHDGRSQLSQAVDAAEHFSVGIRRGEIVVLVAISAGEIASPCGNDVGQQTCFVDGSPRRSSGFHATTGSTVFDHFI